MRDHDYGPDLRVSGASTSGELIHMFAVYRSNVAPRQIGFALLFAIAGVVALYLGLMLPREMRIELYVLHAVTWSELTLLALLTAGVAWTIAWMRRATSSARRCALLDILLALILTATTVTLVPGRSLIEADESLLTTAAISINTTGTTATPVQGIVDAEGTLHVAMLSQEKRGALFSRIVAPLLKQGLSGEYAARLINSFALFGIFLIAARSGRRLAPAGAHLLPTLLATFPLLLVTARLGTFDTLNFLLLLLLIHLSQSQWYQPKLLRLLLIVATAACLAQLRYESILPATVALLLGMLRTITNPSTRQPDTTPCSSAQTWIAAALPFCLVPVTWRLSLPMSTEMPSAALQVWGWDNVVNNSFSLLQWTFTTSSLGVGSPVVAMLAAAMIVHALRRAATRKNRSSWTAHGWILLAMCLPILAVLLWSFWGQINYLVTARYFLFWTLLLSMAATAFILSQLRSPVRRAISIGVIGVAMAFSLQHSHRAAVFEFPQAEFRDHTLSLIDKLYPGCPVVVLTSSPAMFIARNLGALAGSGWGTDNEQLMMALQAGGVRALVATKVTLKDGSPYTNYKGSAVPVGSLQGALVDTTLLEVWRSAGTERCSTARPPIQAMEMRAFMKAFNAWYQSVLSGEQDRIAEQAAGA